MNTSQETPRDNRAGTRAQQRFGHVAGHHASSRGTASHPGNYLVRDEDTGITYTFDYSDIVTEGFRAIRTGERVRFLIDLAHPGRASYIIRLDLPDIGEYYK